MMDEEASILPKRMDGVCEGRLDLEVKGLKAKNVIDITFG